MLIIYLAALIIAMVWVIKLLGPEMLKPLPPQPQRSSKSVKVTPVSQTDEPQQRIEKLEFLLAEKNKNIQLLQTELKVFHAQLRDFEKLKAILEEEIRQLREQNTIFRSELGMPAMQGKENSVA